jgi:hypothetical protein
MSIKNGHRPTSGTIYHGACGFAGRLYDIRMVFEDMAHPMIKDV